MAQSRVGSSGNKVLAELSQDPTARKNKHDELRRKFDALERHADFLETRLKATEKSGNQGAYNAILQQLQNAETRINNLATEMNSIAESDRYSKEQERKRQKIPDSKPKTMMDSVRESLPYQIGSGIRDMIVDTGKGIGQTALYGENAIRGSTLGKNDKGFTTLQLGKAGTQLNPNTMQMEDIQFGDVADVYAKELGKNTGTYIDALNSMMHWRQGRLKPDSQNERFRKVIGDAVPRIFGTKDIEDPTVAKGAEVIADPLAVLGGAVKGAKVTAKTIDEFGDIAKGIRTADGQYIPRSQLGAIDVWHGSGREYDKFDSKSNKNAGSGGDAYGTGGYHSSAKDIAEHFAISASKGDANKRYLYKNKLMWDDPSKEASDPLSPDHFIDWFRPFDEQSQYVKDQLSDLDEYDFGLLMENIAENSSGRNMYDGARLDFGGSTERASEELFKKGIAGIKYRDNPYHLGVIGRPPMLWSDDLPENYVTFSDSLVNVLERDGMPIGMKAGDKIKINKSNTAKKEALNDFIRQYRQNPLNPRESIIGNALVEIQPNSDGSVHLSNIRTLNPSAGESSKALKAVTDMADANGIDISLFAVPYGDSGLKKKQLIEWYKRNGFIKVRGDEMVRKAKK
jgi:hypothetical protein